MKKRKRSGYRKNRDLEILGIRDSGRSTSETAVVLWGEGYHPFQTDSAMRKYIMSATKRAEGAIYKELSSPKKKVWWRRIK
jgi:hypothetical protein